jgi:nitrite reductase/ring-hydroxylating ferredoxin subunit
VSAAGVVSRYPVGRVEDFVDDEFRTFEVGGRPIGVVRTGGSFYAIRNRCPHQGAEICAGRVMGTMRGARPHHYEYDTESRIVICPWHRWEFALDTGGSVGQVVHKRVVTYDVDVDDDGHVFVVLRKGGARERV